MLFSLYFPVPHIKTEEFEFEDIWMFPDCGMWNVCGCPRSWPLLASVFTPEVPGLHGTLRETNKGAEPGLGVPTKWCNLAWVKVSTRPAFGEFPVATQQSSGGETHNMRMKPSGLC